MKQLTEKDLVKFGRYIMSDKRKELFKSHPESPKGLPIKDRLNNVYDSDIHNFM